MVQPQPQVGLRVTYSNTNQLLSFYGESKEDPLGFIREFCSVVSGIPSRGLNEGQMRMRCFPKSMKNKVKQWLLGLPPNSLTNWDMVFEKFVNRFYSSATTDRLRREISNFDQEDGETFHEAWDRFKDLLQACPHHGFDDLGTNNFLFVGLSTSFYSHIRKMTLSGCGFLWEDMSDISRLPLLEVLKLRKYAFRGEIWDIIDPEYQFTSLRSLLLEDLDVECLNGCFWGPGWEVDPMSEFLNLEYLLLEEDSDEECLNGCFPVLQCLTIRYCYKLHHIDPHLFNVSSLDRIELDDCSLATEIWARQMGDKAKDEGLQVYIHSSRNAKNKYKY